MRASNWIEQADQALIRAADRARALAASTNTAIHIMQDGKIVEIRPRNEIRYPTSSKFEDEPELAVVREDTPPYGNLKP